jgi:hypothetical protein
MGSRDSWFMASTLVAGCVFLGSEPTRAGSTPALDDPARPHAAQMEQCDAIRERYAEVARQFASQARQIANDTDRAERLVPAQYIPTKRWQADYDRALLLNHQSVETYRLGDVAFHRCAEAALVAQRQREWARAREAPRANAYQLRRNQAASIEAP